MGERSGAPPPTIARAYLVARDVFALRALWTGIEALDNKVPAAAQYRMLRATQRLLERAVLWFVRQSRGSIDIAAETERVLGRDRDPRRRPGRARSIRHARRSWRRWRKR